MIFIRDLDSNSTDRISLGIRTTRSLFSLIFELITSSFTLTIFIFSQSPSIPAISLQILVMEKHFFITNYQGY